MLLYFDAIFFPFWALTIGSVFHIKVFNSHFKNKFSLSVIFQYEYLSSTYKFICITMLASVFVVQILRLYLGYLGNLTEKVHRTTH